jgi:hypothetical protein
MAAPFLVACLVALRTEFNLVAPHRDKGADGWIGDLAHQQEVSDHNPDETGRVPVKDADILNEVHAIDIDKDLGPGLDLDVFVERIRLAHLAGRDNRLQYIIWRGRIASRSWRGTVEALRPRALQRPIHDRPGERRVPVGRLHRRGGTTGEAG